MEMVEYKKTGDYQKAKKLVCEFIEEVLDGKVDNLLNADLYELSEDCILIVLVENLNEKIFVFDMQDGKKIIRKILSSE